MASGALSQPAGQQGVEVHLPDAAPQRRDRHRAPLVDRVVEEVGDTGVAEPDLPEAAPPGRTPGLQQPAVDLVSPHLVGVAPLRVGRQPLVEPDVAPASQRDVVAEPLVGHLVHHQADVVAGGTPDVGVGRASGVLQREARGHGVDHAAEVGVGVVAQPGLQPPGDGRGTRQEPEGAVPLPRGQSARHRVDRGPSVDHAATQLEAPGGEEGEVGHDRLVLTPLPGGPAVPDDAAHQAAVADRLLTTRHPDRHVVRGLVRRGLVGGEPPGPDLRLADGGRLAPGPQEGTHPGGIGRRGLAVVAHLQGEVAAGADRHRGDDPQLVAVGLVEPGGLPVDLHPVGGQDEVDAEAAQRPLAHGRRHRGASPQRAVTGRHGGDDVVVAHLVAAVAVEREVGVTAAVRPVDRLLARVRHRCHPGQRGGEQRERCDQQDRQPRSRSVPRRRWRHRSHPSPQVRPG